MRDGRSPAEVIATTCRREIEPRGRQTFRAQHEERRGPRTGGDRRGRPSLDTQSPELPQPASADRPSNALERRHPDRGGSISGRQRHRELADFHRVLASHDKVPRTRAQVVRGMQRRRPFGDCVPHRGLPVLEKRQFLIIQDGDAEGDGAGTGARRNSTNRRLPPFPKSNAR